MSRHVQQAAKHLLAIIADRMREIDQLQATLDALGVPTPKRRAALSQKIKAAEKHRASVAPSAGGPTKPKGKASTLIVLQALRRRPLTRVALAAQLQPLGWRSAQQLAGPTANFIRQGWLRQISGKRLKMTRRGEEEIDAMEARNNGQPLA